jgi:hypothetical protein
MTQIAALAWGITDMQKMGIRRLVGALITLCTAMTASCAFAADVDWRLYGTVSGKQWCFYDAKGVTRRPDGHIHVWTKCLLKEDMDRIDIQKDYDRKILEETAEKLLRNYTPRSRRYLICLPMRGSPSWSTKKSLISAPSKQPP